jgi:hypothetical protein
LKPHYLYFTFHVVTASLKKNLTYLAYLSNNFLSLRLQKTKKMQNGILKKNSNSNGAVENSNGVMENSNGAVENSNGAMETPTAQWRTPTAQWRTPPA